MGGEAIQALRRRIAELDQLRVSSINPAWTMRRAQLLLARKRAELEDFIDRGQQCRHRSDGTTTTPDNPPWLKALAEVRIQGDAGRLVPRACAGDPSLRSTNMLKRRWVTGVTFSTSRMGLGVVGATTFREGRVSRGRSPVLLGRKQEDQRKRQRSDDRGGPCPYREAPSAALGAPAGKIHRTDRSSRQQYEEDVGVKGKDNVGTHISEKAPILHCAKCNTELPAQKQLLKRLSLS